jgi:hypothetical protein
VPERGRRAAAARARPAAVGDAHTTDEHCFSRICGGKFVRDEHVVHRDGRPDAFGESIYLWDPAAGRLEYLYIESAGDDAYDVVTECQVQDRWVPGFSLHMQRVQNAPT